MALNEKDQALVDKHLAAAGKTHEKVLAALTKDHAKALAAASKAHTAAVKAERQHVDVAVKAALDLAKGSADKVEKKHAVAHLTGLKAAFVAHRQADDAAF